MLCEGLHTVVEDVHIPVLVLGKTANVLLNDGTTVRFEVLPRFLFEVRKRRGTCLLHLFVFVEHLHKNAFHHGLEKGLFLSGVRQLGRPSRVAPKSPASDLSDYWFCVAEESDEVWHQFGEMRRHNIE